MLEAKRQMEVERNKYKAKMEEQTKAAQQEILNKGGNKRAPLRFSLGGK